MIYFDYKKIMRPKTVIHCDTEEKAKALLKWADTKELRWADSTLYLKNNRWHFHDQKTCYDLYKGKYGEINYYKGDSHKIITYEEALLKMKYKLIKYLTGQQIYEEACEEEFEIFTKRFGFRQEVTWDKENEDFIMKQNGWIKFLIKHKFIEPIEEIFYSVGDRFKRGSAKLILAQTGSHEINLIVIKGNDTGNRWNNPIKVKDIYKITEDELSRITTINKFERYFSIKDCK